MRRTTRATPRRRGLVVTALVLTAAVLFVTVVVAAVLSRSWFGGRLVVFAVPLALAVLCFRAGFQRGMTLLAALMTALATTAVATDLDLQPNPEDRDIPADVLFLERLFERDLPPFAAHLTVGATALLTLTLVALGFALGREWDWSRRVSVRRGAAAVALTILLIAGTLGVGAALGEWNRYRAESATVSHETARPAERLRNDEGPARPTKLAWQVDLPGGINANEPEVAVVPDWDVVLVWWYDGEVTGVTAYAKTDGAMLWTYQRNKGLWPVAVDPKAGRVLFAGTGAAVVLRLSDGLEVARQRLPEGRECSDHLDDGYDPHHEVGATPALTVGSTVVLYCRPESDKSRPDLGRYTVVDVATGDVAAEVSDPSGCRLAVAPTKDALLGVRWGEWRKWSAWTSRPKCQHPELWRIDDKGPVTKTSIDQPGTGPLPEACDCRRFGVTVAGELILLEATARDSHGYRHNLIALGPDGRVRWRSVDSHPGDPDNHPRRSMAAVTRHGIVVSIWRGHWALLSPADGEVVTRSRALPGELNMARAKTADSERVYVASMGSGIVVRKATDLSVIGVHQPFDGFIEGNLFTGAGRLIVHDRDRNRLSAYEDGPPLQRP